MDDERYSYERGVAYFHKINGENADKLLDLLHNLSPDLTRYVLEFAYGEIYARPALDLKSREIAAIAGLTALGNAPSQLHTHIHGALNVGCTREEVLEVIIQMAAYTGFPLALNALRVAHQVFKERDESEMS